MKFASVLSLASVLAGSLDGIGGLLPKLPVYDCPKLPVYDCPKCKRSKLIQSEDLRYCHRCAFMEKTR